MSLLLATIAIWALAGLAGRAAAARADGALRDGAQDALRDARRLAPRLALAILAAGFLARLAPTEAMEAWLGAEAGFGGVALAVGLGAATPGGPVLAYTLAGAAFTAGAGAPQILAYVTAWLLYSAHRSLVWEAPVMGGAFLLRRVLLSLPVPFLVALAAMGLS